MSPVTKYRLHASRHRKKAMLPAITGFIPLNLTGNHTGGLNLLQIVKNGIVGLNKERVDFATDINVDFKHFRVVETLLFHTEEHDRTLRNIHDKILSSKMPTRQGKAGER